jgi:hypothetical protein
MSFHLARFFLQFGISSRTASINSSSGYYHLLFNPNKRKFTATAIPTAQKVQICSWSQHPCCFHSTS